MKSILPYILSRLGEASTWRGIIALLTSVGITLAPDQQEAVITVGLAVIGAIGVFFKDKAVAVAPVAVAVAVPTTDEEATDQLKKQ